MFPGAFAIFVMLKEKSQKKKKEILLKLEFLLQNIKS